MSPLFVGGRKIYGSLSSAPSSGLTEEEIEKIWGKNLMRVFREVQAIAESMQIETQA